MKVAELEGTIGLDLSSFNRDALRAESKLKSLGGGLSGLGKMAAIGMAAAGAAVVAGAATMAAKGIAEFSNLERGMNEVFTLLPGISDSAMGAMTQDVRDFSKDFGVLPDEVVPALYQALSAGVPPDNVFEFLETANSAAVGGVTDLTTAVDGISSVVNAYGDQIGGAGEASDLMFTAVRLGKTTFEELSASLSNVTPIAAANGVAFSDVTAALATMTAQGIPTAQATTQIRQAIVELSDSGSEVGKAFEAVAGTSFRAFIEEGGNMEGALGVLKQAADASGVGIDQLFGSVEAGGAALALSGDNAAAFAGNIDAMAESAGATQGAYEQMDQGLSRSWERIKVGLNDVVLQVGENLAPAFQGFADWIQENMPAIQETITSVLEGIGTFIAETLVPAIQSLIPVFVDMKDTIVKAINLVSENWNIFGPLLATGAAIIVGALVAMGVQALITAGQMAVAWVIGMGPIFWVGAAIVALVALVVANWDTIKEKTIELWETVKSFTKSVWSGLTSWLSDTWDSIKSAISDAWGIVKSTTKDAWESVKRTTKDAWESAKRTVSDKISDIVAYAKELPGRIISAIARLLGDLRDSARDAWTAFMDAAKERMGELLEFVRELPGRIISGLAELGELLLSAATAAWNLYLDASKEITDRVLDFVGKVPGRVVSALGNVGRLLYSSGKAIIQGLLDGISNMIGRIGAVVGRAAQKVRDFWPFSPAKEGPLSGSGSMDIAGANIGRMIADGIESSRESALRASQRLAMDVARPLGDLEPEVRVHASSGLLRSRYGGGSAEDGAPAQGSTGVVQNFYDRRQPGDVMRETARGLEKSRRRTAYA